MIHVARRLEPSSFDRLVRQPGRRFLSKNPSPTSRQYSKHPYWNRITNEMHAAYGGICAYTCFYLVEGNSSVDHFLPKSNYPGIAYEWNNYRLAGRRVNQHKDNSENILDPFTLERGWFVLEFPSCLVKPADSLAGVQQTRVQETIDVLKLNADDSFVQERCDLMVAYSNGDVTLAYLESRYPFLAAEIERQAIQGTVQNIFKKRSS